MNNPVSFLRRRESIFIYVFSFLIFLYALYSLFRIATSLAPDFSVFYDAARGLVSHQNIYTLPMFTGLGYPPFTLLPFIPLTFLPYQFAQVMWVLFSFALFLASIYLSLLLIRKKVALTEYCIVFILGFLAFPTKFTLGMGQVNFLALVLLLLAMRYKSGVFLGFLFIMKPHFLLFLPLFFLARRWKMIVVSLVTVLISILLTGQNLYQYYFSNVVPQLLVFAGRGIYYNQGLGAFFSRIVPNMLAGQLTTWVSLLCIVGGLWFIWDRRLKLEQAVLLFIPIFLLVEPLSWQHHYVFLLPVYIWLVTANKRNRHWLLLAISYVLVAINFRNPPTFLLSHVFFGNVLLLYLVVYEMA